MSIQKYQAEYVWRNLGRWTPERLQEIVQEIGQEFGNLIQDYHIENVFVSGSSSTPSSPREVDYYSWVSWGGYQVLDPEFVNDPAVPCCWDLRSWNQLQDFYNYLVLLNKIQEKNTAFS